MFGPYELAHGFIKVNNRSAMLEYVELAVHTMVSYGIDGFALDIEGDCYSVLAASATARASWTDFLVTLKARMTEAVPGSHLAVWTATTGGPWNAQFTAAQIASAVASVDEFLIMAYSMCSFMVANAPLPTLSTRFQEIMGVGKYAGRELGIPAEKWVLVLPWWGCDFSCGADGRCPLLRGPLRYRHNTPTDPALANTPLASTTACEPLALTGLRLFTLTGTVLPGVRAGPGEARAVAGAGGRQGVAQQHLPDRALPVRQRQHERDARGLVRLRRHAQDQVRLGGESWHARRGYVDARRDLVR